MQNWSFVQVNNKISLLTNKRCLQSRNHRFPSSSMFSRYVFRVICIDCFALYLDSLQYIHNIFNKTLNFARKAVIRLFLTKMCNCSSKNQKKSKFAYFQEKHEGKMSDEKVFLFSFMSYAYVQLRAKPQNERILYDQARPTTKMSKYFEKEQPRRQRQLFRNFKNTEFQFIRRALIASFWRKHLKSEEKDSDVCMMSHTVMGEQTYEQFKLRIDCLDERGAVSTSILQNKLSLKPAFFSEIKIINE